MSDAGDVVDAVVPFMGESISDGTLAKFLKSMNLGFSFPISSIQVSVLSAYKLLMFVCI